MALSDTALVTLIQAKNYLRVDAAANLHVDAEYVGVGDNIIVAFPLVNAPIEGTLRVYVDNVLKTETTHYTYSRTTLTFTTAGKPGVGAGITVSYDYAAGENTFESYDDDLLETLIEAATKKAEEYTGRAFIQREIVETRIGDNKQVLKLYRQPVIDVTSVTVGGVALASWSERLSIGRIYHLVVWPLDYEIVVTYVAGYGADWGATQALIPDAVAAVLGAVAAWYENRVEDAEGLPEASKKKLDSLRVSVI